MANTTDARPTASETRAPNMTAERISRPWSSVPSGYTHRPRASHHGGSNDSERLSVRKSNGLCGASHGANTAAMMQKMKTAYEIIATGERRKLQARSPSHAARARERKDGVETSEVATSFI